MSHDIKALVLAAAGQGEIETLQREAEAEAKRERDRQEEAAQLRRQWEPRLQKIREATPEWAHDRIVYLDPRPYPIHRDGEGKVECALINLGDAAGPIWAGTYRGEVLFFADEPGLWHDDDGVPALYWAHPSGRVEHWEMESSWPIVCAKAVAMKEKEKKLRAEIEAWRPQPRPAPAPAKPAAPATSEERIAAAIETIAQVLEAMEMRQPQAIS